jgi:hypothetical protein
MTTDLQHQPKKTPPYRRSSPAPLAGLFSTGRSGSTWLGAMLGTHRGIAYRFEPHGRGAGSDPLTTQAVGMIRTSSVSTDLLEEIRRGLLVSDPYADKPPFSPREKGTLRLPWLRGVMWPLARKFPALVPAWRRLFTPTRCESVLFKLVAHENPCRHLLDATTMPIIYLVRHPFGVIASILEGQRRGLMPSGRASVIGQFVEDNAPDLHMRFGDRIPGMAPHQHEAFLWRWSVERSLGDFAARDPSRLLMIHYENACRSPTCELNRAFDFLGLPPDPQAHRFIELSSDPKSRGVRESGINRYFSVFRNPLDSLEKWRRSLGVQEQEDILEIVHDSPVFRSGVDLAGWWDRPSDNEA